MKYVWDDICYFDTDSIHTTKKLPEFLIDNNELGKMKLENIFSNAYWLGAKIYFLWGSEKKNKKG